MLYEFDFWIDVYSYDEDDMVVDPYLDKHLSHFGINIKALEKVRTSSDSQVKHTYIYSSITRGKI